MPEESLQAMPPGLSEDAIIAMAQTMMISTIIISLIGAIITVIIFWKIFSKAGYSGWLSLTQLIPLVNLIVLFYVAFAEWPIRRQLSEQAKA